MYNSVNFIYFYFIKKGNADEESIKRFIEQMNSCVENLSAVFTEILEFFINQRPRLTNETITVLF